MCIEVKTIKENYDYDFSRLLLTDDMTVEDRKMVNIEIENLATNLYNSIITNNKKNIIPILNNSYAVPIVGISKHFGFLNYKANFSKLSNEFAIYRNASGMISITADNLSKYKSDKILLINPDESLEHQRFTIAHELAHYLFDFNERRDSFYIDFYRTEDTYINKRERRASRFAAALLMPKDSFVERYHELQDEKKTKYEIVSQLAKNFIVSVKAIDLRITELTELGLLTNG